MTLLSPLKHFHQTNTRRSAVQIDHANGGTDGVSGAPGFVLPWRAGLGGKRVEKCAEEEHPSCVSMGKRGWERRLGPGERREEEERLGPRPKSLFLGARPGRPVLGAPRCGSLRNATSPPDPRSVLRVRHEACRGARSANTS